MLGQAQTQDLVLAPALQGARRPAGLGLALGLPVARLLELWPAAALTGPGEWSRLLSLRGPWR